MTLSLLTQQDEDEGGSDSEEVSVQGRWQETDDENQGAHTAKRVHG